jgi:hypothetical protein
MMPFADECFVTLRPINYVITDYASTRLLDVAYIHFIGPTLVLSLDKYLCCVETTWRVCVCVCVCACVCFFKFKNKDALVVERLSELFHQRIGAIENIATRVNSLTGDSNE